MTEKVIKNYHYQFWTEKPLNLSNEGVRIIVVNGSRLYERIYNDVLTDKQKDQVDQILKDMGIEDVFDKW
jgi:hypothetical protein